MKRIAVALAAWTLCSSAALAQQDDRERESRRHRERERHFVQPTSAPRPGDPDPYAIRPGDPNPYAPKVGAPDTYSPRAGDVNPYATRGGDPVKPFPQQAPGPARSGRGR